MACLQPKLVCPETKAANGHADNRFKDARLDLKGYLIFRSTEPSPTATAFLLATNLTRALESLNRCIIFATHWLPT
jgi:hypothetical protein